MIDSSNRAESSESNETHMENANQAETVEPTATTKTKKTKAPKEPKPPKAPKEPKIAKVRPTAPLSERASELFESYKALDNLDRSAFIANAREFERVEGVKASKTIAAALTVGARVRITGGDAKLFGKEGVITEARRVRIFVQLDGTEKSVYLFASDVAPLEQLSNESDADETVAKTG